MAVSAMPRDIYKMVEAAHNAIRMNDGTLPIYVPGADSVHTIMKMSKTARVCLNTIEVLESTDNYSVIGYRTGGFAIVANDDEMEPVLGYSTNAVYDPATMPQALRWWIDMVDESLSHRKQYQRVPAITYNTTGIDHVDPLLKTKWGQGVPFNQQCPRKLYSNTGYMATGCIATAMAQIMRYWSYPQKGIGDDIFDIRYYLYADYTNTTYDWDNMLPIYNKESYTQAQGDAVAQLMMHCGVAVGMNYDDDNSGAQSQVVPQAMRNKFGYHENVGYRNRANHTNAEWMGTIYSELAAGRPILYTGQDNKLSYGHAFVFDGYNEDGMVHVNWGWDGDYDGYFDVDVLNSGYMRLEFRDAQSMVMGIGMPEDEIEHKVELAIREDLVLYGSGNSYTLVDENFTLWNMNDYDLCGTVALVLPTRLSTRVLVEIAKFPSTDEWGQTTDVFHSFTYITYPEEFSFTIPRTISNGEYYAYLAFREDGYDEWQPLWAPDDVVNYFRITKNGNDFEVVGMYGQYTTGIDSAPGDESSDTVEHTYNLNGQRVNDNACGVVIKNGKVRVNKQ